VALFGFEGSKLRQSALLFRPRPDAQQFGLDFTVRPSGHGIQDTALLMQETALPRRRWKQARHRRQQSVVAVGDDEIHLGGSARSQVVQRTHPALFALLGTGTPRQHLFVASQVYSQCGQDHGRVGLISMTRAEMDAIQVQDAPVLLQRALAPVFELLLEILVEATDGTGAGGHSHQGLGHFPHLVGAYPGHEHLREPIGDLRLVASVALEDLGVELALAISGNVQRLYSACGRAEARGYRTRCDSPCAWGYSLSTRLRSARRTPHASRLPTRCEWPRGPVHADAAGIAAEWAVLGQTAPLLSRVYWVWYTSSDEKQA
jgi:hypothetical protein